MRCYDSVTQIVQNIYIERETNHIDEKKETIYIYKKQTRIK